MEYPNIALVAPPGFLGHLIPFVELARNLVSDHNCTVTLILPHDAQPSLLQHIPAAITPLFLPPPPDDPPAPRPEVLMPMRVIRSLPALRDALSTTPAAALVMDLFAPYAIDLARELQIPAFIFYVIAANQLALPMDPVEEVKLPGSDVVLRPQDIPESMRDVNSEVYKWMVELSHKLFSADGILVNSFHDLETAAFKQLQILPGIPPVYPIGPLIRRPEANFEPECVESWLNDQPPDSVIFVSFGSGSYLKLEQIQELAGGLEMSGQRFLWVVRAPQETSASAYLKAAEDEEEKSPLQYLPEGFVERTRGRGMVVASWAPQVEVLGHASTGGFLTHCGWNSILESAVNGVAMIAWPLCFEQRMNAVFLSEELKGAIRVRENEDGIIEKEQISEVVKEVMEGEQGRRIRNRMMQIKDAAGEALSEDGSSTRALAKAVEIWKNSNSNKISD